MSTREEVYLTNRASESVPLYIRLPKSSSRRLTAGCDDAAPGKSEASERTRWTSESRSSHAQEGCPQERICLYPYRSGGCDHGASTCHRRGTRRTHWAHCGSRLGPYTRGCTHLPHAYSACGRVHADGSVRRRADAGLRRIERAPGSLGALLSGWRGGAGTGAVIHVGRSCRVGGDRTAAWPGRWSARAGLVAPGDLGLSP